MISRLALLVLTVALALLVGADWVAASDRASEVVGAASRAVVYDRAASPTTGRHTRHVDASRDYDERLNSSRSRTSDSSRFLAAKGVPRTGGWTLPRGGGGAEIGGRSYTEHALERMAPRTPEVMAELEARALARAKAAGLRPGTPEFGKWWGTYGPDPRGIPPSVVEAEIANPGSTGIRVITSPDGRVITVIPGG